MADATKPVRRRARSATKPVEDTASDVQDQAEDTGQDVAGGAQDAAGSATNGGSDSGAQTITAELKETFRDAAMEVLRPVMKQATTTAAKYAVTQGPNLVKNKVGPRIQDAGGAGALAKGLTSKGGGVAEKVGGVASGIGGAASGITEKLGGGKKEGKSPTGTGRGRRLPVQVFVDVGVDVKTAYDLFTQFTEWPKFMHRVERLEQRDDTTLMWHENIWGVRRSWESEITDQKPCEKIAWRSKSGPQSIGVVTFHELADRLTRIYITMDFQPQGLFEKTASGMRMSRRALKSDLMRFKAYAELKDEPTGGWFGTIEDGEVVDDGSEQGEDQQGEDQDTEASAEDQEASEDVAEDEPADEEPEASEEDEPEEDEPEEDEPADEEPEASEEDDFADEDEEESDDEPSGSSDEEEEAEEEPAPPPRPRRRRRTATASTRSRG
jgi:uncharacterized membrane protein